MSDFVRCAHQEGTEKDEGDKVGVGEGAAAFGLRVARGRVARFATETGQHDFVPGLARGAPACPHKTHTHTQKMSANE